MDSWIKNPSKSQNGKLLSCVRRHKLDDGTLGRLRDIYQHLKEVIYLKLIIIIKLNHKAIIMQWTRIVQFFTQYFFINYKILELERESTLLNKIKCSQELTNYHAIHRRWFTSVPNHKRKMHWKINMSYVSCFYILTH